MIIIRILIRDIFFYLIFICLIFLSCNRYPDEINRSLELAGANRIELEKFLDYYKGDRLKYKAAQNMIGNMPYYNYNDMMMEFDHLYESLALILVGEDKRKKSQFIRLL